VSCCSLVTNVGLNYALIFGKLGFPELGIEGAAIATLIARIVESAIIAIYVFLYDKRLRYKPSDLFTFDRLLLRDFVRYGTPIIAGQIVWATNMMASSAILGRFSESVTSAVSVANTMNSLAYVTMNGMSAAVGIITGKTVGAGKTQLMKEYARTVQLLFLAVGLFTGSAVFLLRHPFTSLYTGISAEAAACAVSLITVLAVSSVGTCYQAACLAGLVKAGGDVGFVFKNDTLFVFLIVLPSAVLASYLGAPPWAVFACLKCDQILKCFVAVVKINSFNWMKNLTRSNSD
jgi:Na+-driven multidrug efflux pump